MTALSGCKKPVTERTPAEQKKEADEDALRVKLTTIPTKEQLTKKPAIKGKAVYFEESAGRWGKENAFIGDSTGYSAISGRLTYGLKEAGTVILKTSCKNERSGNYGAVPAYVESCVLLVIDPAIPAVVYKERVDGKLENIATLRKSTTRVDASVSAPQIYQFIGSLAQN